MKQQSQQRIRIAVVGCGIQMTNSIYPALQLQDVDVVAACDIDDGRLQAFSRRFGVEKVYRSFDHLLDQEVVHGVCIAVGPREHPALVTSALHRDVRVFVEKPPAMSAAEAKAVQELSERKATQVMVGFNKRFAAVYRSVMQIGKLAGERRPIGVAIRATCGRYKTDELLLKDFGIHYVDLVRYFLGEVKLVHALRRQVDAGTSVYCVNMEMANGGIAQIFLTSLDSWANPSERVFVQWKEQAIEVNNLTELTNRRQSTTLWEGWNNSFNAAASQHWQPNFSAPSLVNNSAFLSGYLGEIAQFINIIRLGLPASPSIHDAVANLTVVESIMQSLDSGSHIIAAVA